jgi:hypothetical protein
MKTLRTTLLPFALAALVLAGAPHGAVDAQGTGHLAVVVSASAPFQELSTAELRRVFLGQTVEKGGVKLIPLNHPIKGAHRTRFDRAVLRMSPDEVGRYWVAERIRGARSAPKSVSSSALLLKVVAKIPGAISYVPASEVRPGVKVVRIDGKLPGDSGYLLD